MLSILIPTYNRQKYLIACLNSLHNEILISGLFDSVEVLVGNNCSEDNTEQVLSEWVKDHNKMNIMVFNHGENLGVVKNLVFLIGKARNDFWMFYGDDDLMPVQTIESVINHLNRYKKYPLHIFNQINYKPIDKESTISIGEFVRKFYYYSGNACTIASTRESHNILKEYEDDVYLTCWPQTHIYLLIIGKSRKDTPIVLSPLIIYEEQPQNLNNIINSFRAFDTPVYSLIKLSRHLKNKHEVFKDTKFKAGIKEIKGLNNLIYPFKSVLFYFHFLDSRKEKKEFKSYVFNSFLESDIIEKLILVPYLIGVLIPSKVYRVIYLFVFSILKNPLRFLDNKAEIILRVKNMRMDKSRAKNLKHSHTTQKGSW